MTDVSNGRQHIVVVEYNLEWNREFEKESALIKDVLGDNCIAIHHIGSTAVSGLAAKPIIDMMPVVKSLEAVDAVRDGLEALGYEYMGEFGIPGRRYMRKGGSERTHQVHVFREDDRENIERHLAFRDYLRTHDDARDEYARLKKELAVKFPYDIDGYCDGKDEFVKRLEKIARGDERG